MPPDRIRSSGDLLADRRYRYAEAALAEGDFGAAADLARQTIELVPDFAAAWFTLGQALAEDGEASAEAVAAFGKAAELDPSDGLGARLRLAALGVGSPAEAMSPAYVRALFDDYAPRFERQLTRGLGYRAPALLHDAVRRTCSRLLRPFRFEAALDLGCGTGLAARAFGSECAEIAGVDLSPAMIAKAEASGLYKELAVAELLGWLNSRGDASADLVLAADVFVYTAELAPIFTEARRVLSPEGLVAFTVQSYQGEGYVLGPDLRYAHSEACVREAAEAGGLTVALLEPASTRRDRGTDVPGLVCVLTKSGGREAQRSLPSGANR